MTTSQTCTHCPNQGAHIWLTPDGPHLLCWACLIGLAADTETRGTRLVISLAPAPVVTR